MTVGHAFVLRGDLRRLVADAWLLPADKGLNVSRSWWGFAPDTHLISLPADWDTTEVASRRFPARNLCWISNVGRYGQSADWYAGPRGNSSDAPRKTFMERPPQPDGHFLSSRFPSSQPASEVARPSLGTSPRPSSTWSRKKLRGAASTPASCVGRTRHTPRFSERAPIRRRGQGATEMGASLHPSASAHGLFRGQ